MRCRLSGKRNLARTRKGTRARFEACLRHTRRLARSTSDSTPESSSIALREAKSSDEFSDEYPSAGIVRVQGKQLGLAIIRSGSFFCILFTEFFHCHKIEKVREKYKTSADTAQRSGSMVYCDCHFVICVSASGLPVTDAAESSPYSAAEDKTKRSPVKFFSSRYFFPSLKNCVLRKIGRAHV